MRLRLPILSVVLVLALGCDSGNHTGPAEIESKIERLNTEINELIEVSTGETSADCRTKYIAGGNGCGPIFVFGVLGIDTLKLEDLFIELSETQTELYKLEGGPACDLGFPNKDSLVNGTCKACFESDDNLECF